MIHQLGQCRPPSRAAPPALSVWVDRHVGLGRRDLGTGLDGTPRNPLSLALNGFMLVPAIYGVKVWIDVHDQYVRSGGHKRKDTPRGRTAILPVSGIRGGHAKERRDRQFKRPVCCWTT